MEFQKIESDHDFLNISRLNQIDRMQSGQNESIFSTPTFYGRETRSPRFLLEFS